MSSEKSCSLFTRIFAVIGVMSVTMLILVCVLLSYVWFADPFDIRPFIQELTSGNNGSTPEQQDALLKSLGVDRENLPTELTPELEACGREKLGDERVDELLGGAEPSLNDVIKARSCLDNE